MPILHMIASLSPTAATSMSPQLGRRAATDASTGSSSSSSTSDQLSTQWANPSDVLSILLLIGGDIVQKALASTAGGRLPPTCFSFGWVAYAFTALFALLGDGRLLPAPDYPAKVFNLASGYARDNKSFVVGRLLRDNEIWLARRHPLRDGALRVSVYEARECRAATASPAGHGWVRWLGLAVMLVQCGVAAIPVALYLEWGVLMITLAGTYLALLAGSLPQWSAEKLPNRRNSYKNFALTSGNGSRDIMIVLGGGNSLDLEELAAPESPRSTRLWEKHPFLSRSVRKDGKPLYRSNGTPVREAVMFRGVPLGFVITTVACAVQCLLWIALLITVAGLKSHSWYLIAVGGLGMFQNAAVAAVSRNPDKRNLPLRSIEVIKAYKVMDGLMDLEVSYPGLGKPLVDEFFPGGLREDELAWWRGDKGPYDKRRFDDREKRGIPRSPLPKYVPISTPKLGPDKDPDTVDKVSVPRSSVYTDIKSQPAQTQEASPISASPVTLIAPMTRPDQNIVSISEDEELAQTPGLGIVPPKIGSSSAAADTSRDIIEITTVNYAQQSPAGSMNMPSRRGTRETEKTDSSSSTGLSVSMYDIDAIVRTPDWN